MNNRWKKNAALFLISQNISLFGSILVQYAITWYITLETESGLMMTISIICGFIPTFFLSPFAGVWADRYDRKMLIILSDSLIAIATLILAILFMAGYDSIWLLFVASSIRAFGSGIQTPTVGAFIPQLVPQDKLTKVNATNTSIQSLVMIVCPMLSGALMTIADIEFIFFIDVITAAMAVFILLLFLKVPKQEKVSVREAKSYLTDMLEGIKYIRSHKFVKIFIVFSALFQFLIAPAAFLTPLQTARSFGEDVWRLTAIEIAFSGGMMLGGIIMASWGGFKNGVYSMASSNFLVGVSTLLLGAIPNFWLYLFFMMFIGISMPVFNTPAMVIFQQKVDGEFLGRVFGVLGMISSSVMPLGMLVFGPLADLVKIEYMLIGTGIIIAIESLFMVTNKIMIEAGKPVEEVTEVMS